MTEPARPTSWPYSLPPMRAAAVARGIRWSDIKAEIDHDAKRNTPPEIPAEPPGPEAA